MKQSLLLRIKTLNNHKNKNLESLSVFIWTIWYEHFRNSIKFLSREKVKIKQMTFLPTKIMQGHGNGFIDGDVKRV